MPHQPAHRGTYDIFFVYDPDTDGDGLFDSGTSATCEAAAAALGGCPDSDGDKIANKDDLCANLAGGAHPPAAAPTPTGTASPRAARTSAPA